jgi:hypothetical protein
MASQFYNNYFEELGKSFYNATPPSGTVKIALVTTSYTPNFDTHAFYSDLTGEASGAGYTTGGQAVDSLTITQDNTNDRAVIDFADETFSTVTVTNVNAFVLYKDTGTPATSPLIAYIEFTEGTQSTVAGNFVVRPSATGVHTIA